MSDALDNIIRHGNRHPDGHADNNWLVCADGFQMSVIAGYGTYSTPYWLDPDEADASNTGPFTHVEVGYASSSPQPLDEWSQYAETADDPTGVYAHVPVALVRKLVDSHGGITELNTSPAHRRRLGVRRAP